MRLRCFAAGLLLACSLAGAAPLRWAAQNDVLTLDPHSQNHTTTLAVLAHVYEGLVRFDERFEPEPALATRWTALSPTHWRFELRRDVRFHDGTPFTADDVVFSFERIRQPPGNMQVYAAGIREVRRVDNHTVELLLDAPQPTLLKSLVYVNIVGRDWARQHRAERSADFKAKEENFATRHANGTGPFKLLDWQPDQAVRLTAQTAWWGRDGSRSNVSELTYLPIKSAATRVAALLSGDVDIVTDLPPQDLMRAKADARLRILEGPENRSLYIAFDQGSPELRGADVKGRNPFQDKRVREAMNLAVDREAIVRQVLRGFGRPAALMVPPGVNGYDAALDVPARPDLERARRLLAEAGYAKGFEVPLHCPNNRYVNDEAICQALVAMWARIGVRAHLIAQPFALHLLTLQRFESPLYMLGVSAATFDAQIGLQAWGHSYTPGADGYFNYGHLSDARLDALIQGIKIEPDTARRSALLREALLKVRDEAYFVPLLHPLRPWAMKAGLRTVHRANDQFEARYTTLP
ncbi:MAG TPA: ABC transporter substrate-binding protein [Roseateles sp.]